MDKQQIFSFIEGQLAAGKISKEDLLRMASVGGTEIQGAPQSVVKEDTSKNLIHILYGIGAIIAVVGVSILVGQNWVEIGFAGRILVTLGISLIAYILALLFRGSEQKALSQVLFTISAVLAPLGSYVLLQESAIDFTLNTQIATASILFIIFGTALLISKKNILVLITIGFATWAYFAAVLKVFGNDFGNTDFLKWATMVLGASYLLIAYGYATAASTLDQIDGKEKKRIQNVLYAFGTLAVLGAGISIGGAFDVVFIAFIFAAFYGSVFLKSRAMLNLGAIFLMAHIVNITSQYFVDSIGWPIALIGVGFLVIGVGYMTYTLNKKYMSVR